MKKNNTMKILVLLMTYGSPNNLNEVPAYLKNVYGGKDAPEKTIREFKRRYKLIGGSPLIKITENQAKALEKELNKQHLGHTFIVAAAMRFSHPFIEEIINDKSDEVDHIIGIIMSPQYSPIIMNGYINQLKNAVSKINKNKITLKIATDWHMQPFFLQALALRVTDALDTLPADAKKTVPVLFSAHSMPKKVIEKEPNYINDLQETAAAVAKLAGLKINRWMFCYQSAGHTPEEWLKPDFADIMPELKTKGHKYVLIAPIQFLADHLEILYDVGIAAKEQAEEQGIRFRRTESLNDSPLFIKALAEVVKQNF
jgi:ferrochelatase